MRHGISKFFSPILLVLLASIFVGFDGILATKNYMNEKTIERRVNDSKNKTEARDHHDHHQHGYNSGYHNPLKSHDKNKRPKSSYGAPKPQYGPPKAHYGAALKPLSNYKTPAYSQPAPLYSQPSYSPPSYSPSDYSPSEYSSPSFSPPAYSPPYHTPVYNSPAPYSPPYAPSYDPTAYSPSNYPETPGYPQVYSEPSYTPHYSDPEYPYIQDTDKGGNKGVSNNDNGFANFDDFFKQAQKFKQF